MPNYNDSKDTLSKYTFNAWDTKPKEGKVYNTRIAPSPTGHAHIGTFRTALFNFLAARATGGRFILRIDDTDLNRNDEAAVQPILNAMQWLRMHQDSTYRQSDRGYRYREVAMNLVNTGLATVLHNGAIALKWHPEMPLEWTDNISGKMKITPTNIEQIDGKLILLKGKEGKYAPTYQLASTYDDHNLNINYIIRGTDHISNTPKQLAIWWAINKLAHDHGIGPLRKYPEFAHIGLIFKDGKKLSKRDGASSVLEYKKLGYAPEAVIAFMLRLGWAPKLDNKENDLLSMERACDMFITQGKMRNSSANMDVKKLDSYNRKIMAGWTPEKLQIFKNRQEEDAAREAMPEVALEENAFGEIAQELFDAGRDSPQGSLGGAMRVYYEELSDTLHRMKIKKPRRNAALGIDEVAEVFNWAPPVGAAGAPIAPPVQAPAVFHDEGRRLYNPYGLAQQNYVRNMGVLAEAVQEIIGEVLVADDEILDARPEAPPLYNRER